MDNIPKSYVNFSHAVAIAMRKTTQQPLTNIISLIFNKPRIIFVLRVKLQFIIFFLFVSLHNTEIVYKPHKMCCCVQLGVIMIT